MQRLREINKRSPDLVPLVILLLLGIGYFAPVLFGGRAPAINTLRNYEPWRTVRVDSGEGSVLRLDGQAPVYTWDNSSDEGFADDLNRQFLPWGLYSQERLKSFEWPLWNPRVSCGQPMFANHQTGIINPLIYLCYMLFPGLNAFTAIFLSIFILAGWGMYAYLRVLGLGRWPSLLAAVTYQFILGYIPTLDTLIVEKALFPFLLLSIEYMLRTRGPASRGWAAASIILLALVQTTCHAQEAVYISYLTGPYIVFIAGGPAAFGKGRVWINIGRRLLIAVGIYITALLVGAVQNIPTAEFYLASTRMAGFAEQLETTSAFEESLSWIVTMMIAFPRLYGDYICNNLPLEHYLLNYGYVGIFTLLAAPFAGWIGSNRRHVWFWRIACLIFFAALVSNWFYMNILCQLPLFRVSLQPPFSPFFFGLIVLAAHGFKFMLEPKPKVSSANKFMGYTSVLVFGGLAAVAGLYFYSFFLPPTPIAAEQHYVFGQICLGFIVMALACAVVAIFWSYTNTKDAKKIPFDRNTVTSITALVLMLIILLDLWPLKAHFNPFVPKEKLYIPTITTNWIQDNLEWEPGDPDGPYRFGRSWKDIIPPNTGMMLGIDDFGGYDSNLIGRYAQLLTAVDSSLLVGVHYIETPRYRDGFNSKLWNMLGVKYVLAHPAHLGQFDPPEQWRHIYQGELLIMENTQALPRMHVVGKVHVAVDNETELELASSIDPAVEAVIAGFYHGNDVLVSPDLTEPGSPGMAVITDYEPENVTTFVSMNRDGLLCFYDTWFPGWNVSVDGKKAMLERVNYTFKGVLLDEGEHIVVFSYQPESFRTGQWVTLIGLFITMVLAMSGWVTKFTRKGACES